MVLGWELTGVFVPGRNTGFLHGSLFGTVVTKLSYVQSSFGFASDARVIITGVKIPAKVVIINMYNRIFFIYEITVPKKLFPSK